MLPPRVERARRLARRLLRGSDSNRRLRLAVDRDTFVLLHRQLGEAVELLAPAERHRLEAIEPFSPSPLRDAEGALLRWLEQLRRAVDGLPIEISAPDAELSDLLRTVAGRADESSTPVLLRLLGALTGGVFRGPHTFHLDVANACNVNCKYCWFHSPLARKRDDVALFDAEWRRQMVDWDVFTGLVDDLHALGGREDVLLSGKGEPLLHPRCLDMVRYIKDRGMGLSLFTNGLLVRDEARRALVEAGADLLYVSLSSASPSVYEEIHPGHDGEAELEEVKRNLRALADLKCEGAAKPRVMLVDVLCRPNAHEALDFYELAGELGCEHVRYQLIHVQPYNRELALLPEQVGPLREAIAEAHRREADGGPRIVENIDWQLQTLDPATGRWGHGRTPDEGCFVGWTFSRSWTNGDVSFCCSPKVVDNLGERSFKEIWQGADYAAFRNAARDLAEHGDMTFRNGASLLGEHCAGCPNYEGIGKLAGDLEAFGLSRFVRGKDRERLGASGAG